MGFFLSGIKRELLPKDVRSIPIFDHPEDFAAALDPLWQRYKHQRMFGDIFRKAVLDAEKPGKKKRIIHHIITAPPQIGKSYSFSCPFPLWYLNQFPERSILYISHTYSLAEDNVWAARDQVLSNPDLFRFKLANRKKGKWFTDRGGFFAAFGTGSAIPGRRGNLILVDDVYASEEEAFSPKTLEKIEGWFDTSVMSRMQETTLIFIICTWWQEKDLIGHLIEKSKNPEAEQFQIWRFPALSDEETIPYDAMKRKEIGVSVCEERLSAEFFKRRRASVMPYHWLALWQCRPTSAIGRIFKEHHFKFFQEENDILHFFSLKETKSFPKFNCVFFQVTDTNLKDKKQNDLHSTMTLGITPDNDLFIYDIHARHSKGVESYSIIKAQRLKHSRIVDDKAESFIQANFVEDKQAGTIVIQQAEIEKEFVIYPLKAEKNKRLRAVPAYELCSIGCVYIKQGEIWTTPTLEKFYKFTGEEGGDDDEMDCLAYGAIVYRDRSSYGLDLDSNLDLYILPKSLDSEYEEDFEEDEDDWGLKEEKEENW